jgi:hypothetical protein
MKVGAQVRRNNIRFGSLCTTAQCLYLKQQIALVLTPRLHYQSPTWRCAASPIAPGQAAMAKKKRYSRAEFATKLALRDRRDPKEWQLGRIAYGCDGNLHDSDDVLASPLALALLSKNGLAGQLAHYHYNGHFWGDSSLEVVPNQEARMTGV